MADTQKRRDPLPVFCFKVVLPGMDGEAFFKSVSGLKYETEILPYREGGNNSTTYQLVGAMKWSNLVLKNGFTKDSAATGLLKWRTDWTGPRGGEGRDGPGPLVRTAVNAAPGREGARGGAV